MFTGVVAGAAPIAIMPAIGKKMLRINVIVDEVNDLKSDRNVCMITFHGDAESEYFKGKILPGGVDTQRSVEGGMLLSARYMLEGIDMNGKPAKLFIENEGISRQGEDIVTKPVFITDDADLKWLETASLKGYITGTKDGVLIEID